MTNPRRKPALLTRESLRAARACYDADDDRAGRPRRIDALFPPEGRPVDDALVEYLREAGVPDRDIFWALNYACPQVTDRMRRLVACDCARRALEAERAAGREPDVRIWRAVEVAERYARGEETDDELEAAILCASARAAAAAWVESRGAWGAAAAAAAAAAASWGELRGARGAWGAAEAAVEATAAAWRFAVDAFVKIINEEVAA
jgi:hypothetical protein